MRERRHCPPAELAYETGLILLGGMSCARGPVERVNGALPGYDQGTHPGPFGFMVLILSVGESHPSSGSV